MLVILENADAARIEVDGEITVVRRDQSIEITKEDWLALPPGVRAKFEISDFDIDTDIQAIEDRWTQEDDYPIFATNAGATGLITIPTSGTVEVGGCFITVPPTDKEVWIEAQLIFQQTALGVGQVYLYLCEGSASTQITSWVGQLPNNTGGQKYGQVGGKFRIGRVTSHRHLFLRASASFACQGLANTFNPCFIGATIR